MHFLKRNIADNLGPNRLLLHLAGALMEHFLVGITSLIHW